MGDYIRRRRFTVTMRPLIGLGIIKVESASMGGYMGARQEPRRYLCTGRIGWVIDGLESFQTCMIFMTTNDYKYLNHHCAGWSPW